MPTPAETVRRMLLAFQADDGGAFREAVLAYIAEEKRKNHQVVARELERLLGGGQVHRLRPHRSLFAWESEIPRETDRGVPLLHVFEPRRELDALVLDGHVRETLVRFAAQANRAELLRSHGVTPATRLLLCGPPGCGKTSAAEAVARELLLPLAVVRFDAVISSYLGETAANLRKIFDFIASRPMVVLFDEFDAVAKHRDDDFEHGELKRVVNAFLQLLDGLRGDGIVIAATNHQGLLDRAVWRRFDEVVQLDRPDDEARRQVLLQSLSGLTLRGSPDWAALLRMTRGLSHADVERIAQMAVREALLSDESSVTVAALEGAARRYEIRMAIVTGAGDAPASESVSSEAARDAIRDGQSASSPPADEGDRTSAHGQEEAGRRQAQAGARSGTPRNVRPRARAARGSARGGDQDEGAGSGH